MNILEIVKPQEIKSRAYLADIEKTIIGNEADNLKACEMLREVSSFTKSIKAQQKEETAKLKAELDAINAAYKVPLDFLKQADELLRTKINDYATAKMAAAMEAAKRQKLAAEEAAIKKLDDIEAAKKDVAKYDKVTAEALTDALESKQNEIINDTAKMDKINISNDSVSFRSIWTFEVVDISKVPAEYLTVNSKAVNEAIKNGIHEISGLNIKKTIKAAVK